jgi:hypothetical protein
VDGGDRWRLRRRVAALRAFLGLPAGPRATLISTHQLEFVT